MGVTIRCSLFLWTAPCVFRLLRYSCGQHLMFLDYSAASPERRFSVPAPASHRSVVLLAPIGEVVAESYPIRTVIQFSFSPSIGRQREGPEINPLNNQLGTFLPFARKNFCKLFVNGGYNDKKSRYTAHQISGRKSLAISLMKLCTGSEIQKPSMSAFFRSAGRHCTGTAQPQSLSAAALSFISDIQLWLSNKSKV